jgi:hypothetical protein
MNQQRLGDDVELYREAFHRVGSRALWNVRELEDPLPEDVSSIARSLRIHGDMDARRTAERIQQLTGIAHHDFDRRPYPIAEAFSSN